ncbi:aldehyde reductase like protein [Zymoseptoria brevis]|uniref:Aldehyde reductase like protein n=1 Tax=Zymoseptoria brevis TaxID=1047168 RepID=A0A0F4GEK9_9PEZI|nr:aldehyde reductase like protein [Zymoseptoria brevis]
MSGIKVVFGAAGVNPPRAFGTTEAVKEVFDVLENGKCENIDTAALYGQSEKILGEAGIAKRSFIVDTKLKGGFEGGATKENVLAQAKNSKELLGTNVDILYIHAPDHNTPLEETLAAVDEVHKSGFFTRFGLSNYKAEDVQKVYEHCKEKGYTLPSVYQGNYSAVARKQEEVLFPTLRKLGMSFYAYSPLAGGFLTKTKEQVLEGAGRFNKNEPIGDMYATMYAKPSYLEALAQWAAIAKEEGCSQADLAYRWVRYNSPLKKEQGDAIIIGASRLEQLKETLDSINGGPLSDKAAKKIDEVWKTIEHEAPLDNYHK